MFGNIADARNSAEGVCRGGGGEVGDSSKLVSVFSEDVATVVAAEVFSAAGDDVPDAVSNRSDQTPPRMTRQSSSKISRWTAVSRVCLLLNSSATSFHHYHLILQTPSVPLADTESKDRLKRTCK